MNWYSDMSGSMGTWMWIPAVLVVLLIVVVTAALMRGSSSN